MSTAQRTEQTDNKTALALREPAIGNLPTAVQQQLELRRLSNQVAGELAKMNWGASLDLGTRRAIADWGRQFRVDVTTEIYVLGGNIYPNANFYLRRLGELIADGVIEYAYADHIEDDTRLAKLGPEGEGEASRRLRERLMHGVPDAAKSAVAFRVKVRSMEREIVGVKWCGGTGRKDPVGDQFPVETSETRAARRAMRLITSHVPEHSAAAIEDLEASAEELSVRVTAAQRDFKARQVAIEAPPPGRSSIPAASMPLLNPADPYSELDTSRTAEMETAGRPAPVRVVNDGTADPIATTDQKAQIARLLDQADVNDAKRDAYAIEAGRKDVTAARASEIIKELERLVPQGAAGELFEE